MLLSLVPALALMLAAPVSGGQMDFGGGAEEPNIAVSTVLSVTAAAAGESCTAAVVLDIPPPWHVNSAHPRDEYLIPAKVEFDTVPGITPGRPAYPAGQPVLLLGDTMDVYSGRTIIPFTIAVSAGAAGSATLAVRVTYQPCNDIECRAPQTVAAALRVPVASGGVPANEAIFGTTAAPATPAAPATDTLESRSGADAPAEEESDLARLVREHGFWGYFLALGLAFITGLLLSFSPCTYPMIPITVSVFAGRERSMGRGFGLSLVYVVSMAVVYGVMGLIVSLVGGVFGAWLASPPVVIAIVAVFIVFALSMFGLYELQVPLALRSKLGARAGGGGLFGVMVLGVVAALVVSPCVGPFVAGILIYVATSGSPVIGFLVLFVFAMGLGTLYLLIGTFSSAISKLPGSGEWMESVKKFFGFVLLLMALYFLRTLLAPWVTALLAGLLLVGYGVFGGGMDRLTPRSPFFPRLKKFLGVLALVIGIALLVGVLVSTGVVLPDLARRLPAAGAAAPPQHLIAWETDLPRGLARAQGEGKPVVIDTWATWCANCRVLEKKTFGNPDVAAKVAERFVPIKVQLESADSEATRAFMARFGMSHYSLPTTLLLDSQGTVRRVLRGVVGPDEMIAALAGVR